jgi:hypothetical protein
MKWIGLVFLFSALAWATVDITVMLLLGVNAWVHQLIVIPVAWAVYNAGFYLTYKWFYR